MLSYFKHHYLPSRFICGKALLNKDKKANITAVTACDQAVIAIARSIGIQVHISTQLNVTNIETIKFYSLFADIMVLSRELSLRQVKSITDQIKKGPVFNNH